MRLRLKPLAKKPVVRPTTQRTYKTFNSAMSPDRVAADDAFLGAAKQRAAVKASFAKGMTDQDIARNLAYDKKNRWGNAFFSVKKPKKMRRSLTPKERAAADASLTKPEGENFSKGLPSALRGLTPGRLTIKPMNKTVTARVLAHGDGREAARSIARAKKQGNTASGRFWLDDGLERISAGKKNRAT